MSSRPRKRALTLIIDAKEEEEEVQSLRCRPIVTKHYSAEVESSNLGGETSSGDESSNISDGGEECGTPKAAEYRIPKVMTCPPAPRKRRLSSPPRCSAPLPFFCPADLELLFLPRHNIS